ncbi:MAG: phosphatase PAP2 family protein [Thermomicrobiales bacterium]
MDFFIPYIESYRVILGLTGVLLVVRWETQRRFGDSHAIAEATLIYAAYFCYYLVRGLVKEQVATARINAHRVVDLERELRIFVEPRAQDFALGHDWIINAMNWVYVWFHWPVIAIVLVWLFFNYPEEYTLFRNGILISGALALLIFAFFPVAPPRFMPEFGFIDTIEQRSYSQHVLLPSGLANKYAAVPSLHAGWNLLMAIAIYRNGRGYLVKAFGVLLPVLMTSSIVLTGNHYILDFVIGDLLAVGGLLLAYRFFNERARSEPRPPSRPPEVAMPST